MFKIPENAIHSISQETLAEMVSEDWGDSQMVTAGIDGPSNCVGMTVSQIPGTRYFDMVCVFSSMCATTCLRTPKERGPVLLRTVATSPGTQPD
jgi:hypothetical protein